MVKASPPELGAKLEFLKKPETYPDRPQHVEAKETHMSWVFLTDQHAWKLKKPVRNDYVDFSTPEARRLNCLREVQLNRRLAASVYMGVPALTLDHRGRLQLGGEGKPVDWLVQMRRLPANQMMDQRIKAGTVSAQDLVDLVSTLTAFYKEAERVSITCAEYRTRLLADMEDARTELTNDVYGLPESCVGPVIRLQLTCLRRHPGMFDARVRESQIVEAHGDLRPEHICLESPPVIIDCLEFNRNLRILDPASELSFLALECERLGNADIGQQIMQIYMHKSGDRPPDDLLGFYKAHHAVVRAKIALWHLKDPRVRDRAIWRNKAREYLTIAGSAAKVHGLDPAAVRFTT